MLNDKTKITGDVVIERSRNGVVVERREIKNLVVDAGKNLIANRLASNTPVAPSHMAVGTSATAPAAGNTTLGAELVRVANSSATPSGNTVVYSAYYAPGVGTGTLAEAGLFNAASAGTMLCRTTFSPVGKGAPDAITITWTLTIN